MEHKDASHGSRGKRPRAATCLCRCHKIREDLEPEGTHKGQIQLLAPQDHPNNPTQCLSIIQTLMEPWQPRECHHSPFQCPTNVYDRCHRTQMVPGELHRLWFGSQGYHQDRPILKPLRQASTCTGFTQNEYFATSLLSLRVKNILDNSSSSTNLGESDENRPWSDSGF